MRLLTASDGGCTQHRLHPRMPSAGDARRDAPLTCVLRLVEHALGALRRAERPFRPLEEHADACSSYAEVTYRKRRNASSSTPPIADDPIHNRDLTDRRPARRSSKLRGLRACRNGAWHQAEATYRKR